MSRGKPAGRMRRSSNPALRRTQLISVFIRDRLESTRPPRFGSRFARSPPGALSGCSDLYLGWPSRSERAELFTSTGHGMQAAEVLALREALEARFPNAQPVIYRTAGAVETGVRALDALLPGGGLPRGRLVLWAPGGGATAM